MPPGHELLEGIVMSDNSRAGNEESIPKAPDKMEPKSSQKYYNKRIQEKEKSPSVEPNEGISSKSDSNSSTESANSQKRRRSRGSRGGRSRRTYSAPKAISESEDLKNAAPNKKPVESKVNTGSEEKITTEEKVVEKVIAAIPKRRPRRSPRDNQSNAGVPEIQRPKAIQRKGRPVGRYLMCVNVKEKATQIAVLEGRSLIEHYVSRPLDESAEIDGNIYLGRVENVLPGMEAAFVDIGTSKNAVLYRGDLRYDPEDIVEGGTLTGDARIEELLKPGQLIICQVTKNPIRAKGARLTQEVSLPGRFVVLIPNSKTYGISKRLSDDERKRLRSILDTVKPEGHGLIIRTAAEGARADELERDVLSLLKRWEDVSAKARELKKPALLIQEPNLAVRIIREEFNRQYRGVLIDDLRLYNEIKQYVSEISPELADRIQYYDQVKEVLPLFERHHVHEQLHKALDTKVWLPSGGSLIIERTEALTVIDVNTGKNVGTSNLEQTVYENNLEAAEEIARQLRLRDIGGIIVIDFIDMEQKANREGVINVFKNALSRDKTRTQVFDISELGLVEMTRKRVSEGLVESLSQLCPSCEGRGIIIDESLL